MAGGKDTAARVRHPVRPRDYVRRPGRNLGGILDVELHLTFLVLDSYRLQVPLLGLTELQHAVTVGSLDRAAGMDGHGEYWLILRDLSGDGTIVGPDGNVLVAPASDG